MWIAIAIGAVIFIIILAIIGMYNNLVSLKMRVKKRLGTNRHTT